MLTCQAWLRCCGHLFLLRLLESFSCGCGAAGNKKDSIYCIAQKGMLTVVVVVMFLVVVVILVDLLVE